MSINKLVYHTLRILCIIIIAYSFIFLCLKTPEEKLVKDIGYLETYSGRLDALQQVVSKEASNLPEDSPLRGASPAISQLGANASEIKSLIKGIKSSPSFSNAKNALASRNNKGIFLIALGFIIMAVGIVIKNSD